MIFIGLCAQSKTYTWCQNWKCSNWRRGISTRRVALSTSAHAYYENSESVVSNDLGWIVIDIKVFVFGMKQFVFTSHCKSTYLSIPVSLPSLSTFFFNTSYYCPCLAYTWGGEITQRLFVFICVCVLCRRRLWDLLSTHWNEEWRFLKISL